ncbi:MAG: sulfur carrier protein ThiS [Gammaproteobacteria bacterium]|nr:sulfur carrier protein ThiS [Gammaproteobacteria bacterium]MBU1441446.1 sulfur carrier protein ThiS [Gammaproteobacteria bacterium]MBU2286845.1 sulfur carrier protein ThiS [Gammaproteobacteria bacterium]MBU2411176.1 sulfur carrier protein ThiS [Gammaproteobacteria bacterium]
MNVLINDQPKTLPPDATLADALELVGATPPFAAAVNREFVPRAGYASRTLQPDDRIEVIRPVTGG